MKHELTYRCVEGHLEACASRIFHHDAPGVRDVDQRLRISLLEVMDEMVRRMGREEVLLLLAEGAFRFGNVHLAADDTPDGAFYRAARYLSEAARSGCRNAWNGYVKN